MARDMRPLFTLTIVALLAVPFAGCFGAEEIADERSFTASGGSVSPGWAYDGEGLVTASATLSGQANHVDNTGRVESTFEYAGSAWSVVFDDFAETAPFMSGGVAFDLVEHGDTGVADASIPTILARVAAWGTAEVHRDGELVTGLSGAQRWGAHLMVSDTTVRGADGRILKSDGATPYDPASPGDATRIEGQPQAFLVLRSPDGVDAKRQDVEIDESFRFMGPESTQTHVLPARGGAVKLDVVASSETVALGTFSVRILNAAGEELDAASGQVTPNADFTRTFEIPKTEGELHVEMTGAGAFDVALTGIIGYDDHPFLVITWNSVTLN